MTDFPGDEEIERHVQGARHFHAEHHAAAWQGVHHAIVFLVFFQRLRELPARVDAVPEVHGKAPCSAVNGKPDYSFAAIRP
jgi:hypothetical protein